MEFVVSARLLAPKCSPRAVELVLGSSACCASLSVEIDTHIRQAPGRDSLALPLSLSPSLLPHPPTPDS